MPEIITNTLAISRAREAFIGGSLDAKRPEAWTVFGYPECVTFERLRQAYERGGAGHGAVHRLLDKCWSGSPRVKRPKDDAESEWETKVKALFKRLQVWRKLRDLDRRNMVGHYAGLIYRVRDGLPLSKPLQRGELVDIILLWEDQLKVTRWHADPSDPDNFGKPAMWQYRMRSVSSRDQDMQGKPDEWADVHPSRVQVFAEGSVGDNWLEGVPLLRAGFNHLIDIEKISGGSGESYLKNSARTVVLKFDANASPQAIADNDDGTPSGKTVGQAFEEKVDALNRNVDKAIVMQGGDATTLQTTVSDPEPSFNVAANLFAASVRAPMTILFGAQTGRLASDQDRKDWDARCKSRQENELEPMLTEFVTRLQEMGAIEPGEFDIEFAPLDTPGDAEKTDKLGKMATAMKTAAEAGLVEPLFDQNELRKVVGYEERTGDGMPDALPADPAAAGPVPPTPQPAPAPMPRRVA